MEEKQFLQSVINALVKQKQEIEKGNKKYKNYAIQDLIDSLEYEINNLKRELEDL